MSRIAHVLFVLNLFPLPPPPPSLKGESIENAVEQKGKKYRPRSILWAGNMAHFCQEVLEKLLKMFGDSVASLGREIFWDKLVTFRQITD